MKESTPTPEGQDVINEIREAVIRREEADQAVDKWLEEGFRQNIPVVRLAEAAGLKSRQSVYARIGKK